MARLRLFGAPELDSAPKLRFLPERRFRLLAYLALRGSWVGRDELAGLFWPDRPQNAARSNLRKLLLEVRQLEPPALEDENQSLRWIVEHDVAAFVDAHSRGDHPAAQALYVGVPMAGLDGGDSAAFSGWLDGERVRLRALRRTSVLATLADAPATTRLELARRLVDEDPYDEDAVRIQMQALAALGRSADAELAYRSLAERLADGMGAEPSAQTSRLARALQAERPAPAAAARFEPAAASDGFIGRARELGELRARLADPACRLITISGPGGMGTRLVKELLHRLPRNDDAPVFWIALDDLREVGEAAARLAREMGLETAALQDPMTLVSAHLAPLEALVVLDNAEHLAALGDAIDAWLAAAPRLRVIVTSRTRIGSAAESLLDLSGLATTDADADAAAPLSEAGRLFVSQARLAHPRFDANVHADAVARLMHAVGGMPLAILLAASWVRLVPVSDMVADLAQLLDVLEQADDGEERPEHRSVRATFEQSWRLLSAAERELLMALSVFVGSFPRTLAQELGKASLPVLGSLIDKSLVQIDAAARCSLHPLIQQFAAAKLAAEPEREATLRERHASTFARMMKPFTDFDAIDQGSALRAIGAELANVMAAFEWAIAERRSDVIADCCIGLSNYFQTHGPIRKGIGLFARAEAALAGEPTGRGAWSVPLELASFHYWLGDFLQAEGAARRALSRARSQRSSPGIRSSLNTLALALLRRGLLVEAERYLVEAVKRARADKAPEEAAAMAGNLVALKRSLGDEDGALTFAYEVLEEHRSAGHKSGELSMMVEIGIMLHSLSRFAEAIAIYERGLSIAAELGSAKEPTLLCNLASAALSAGQLDRAEHAGLESLRICLESGRLASEPYCRRVVAMTALARGRFDSARSQLLAAIDATRRSPSTLLVEPLLRDCALYFEQRGNAEAALLCVASADAHRVVRDQLQNRHRGQRERLSESLAPSRRDSVAADGAATTLGAALETAATALATEAPASASAR